MDVAILSCLTEDYVWHLNVYWCAHHTPGGSIDCLWKRRLRLILEGLLKWFERD